MRSILPCILVLALACGSSLEDPAALPKPAGSGDAGAVPPGASSSGALGSSGSSGSALVDASVPDGGTAPGCRVHATEPPTCEYEAPLVIDDTTPDENGTIVIRNRCFRQPETLVRDGNADDTEPAIRIRTTKPVLLDHVVTVSAGSHVVADGYADLTIVESEGYGLTPTVDDVPRGNYLTMHGFKRAVVQRSFLSHTRGLQLWAYQDDDGAEDRVVHVTHNVARNLDGRCRNVGQCGNTGSAAFSNFVGFNVAHGKHIEIAWNDVLNEPGESSVQDNLGLYRASGTEDGILRIHHNAIRGGFDFPVTDNFTGSCFTTDGDAETVGAVGFIEATDNLCLGVSLNIAGGHDVHFRNNVYASSGKLPNGEPLTQCFWCIAGIFDYYHGGNLVRDSIENLRYGMPAGSEGVWVSEGEGNFVTVEKMPEPVTLETEAALYQDWCNSAAAAGIVLGP